MVAADVREGFVSRRSAEELYGVLVDEAGKVDDVGTARVRQERRDDLV